MCAPVPPAPAVPTRAPEPRSHPPETSPERSKPRPEGWEDDQVYLHDLLAIAVAAVDPATSPQELELLCSVDFTRCQVRAPLRDDSLDEDTLWELSREAVLEASAGDAVLTRARAIDPEDEPSLMELEITLTIE